MAEEEQGLPRSLRNAIIAVFSNVPGIKTRKWTRVVLSGEPPQQPEAAVVPEADDAQSSSTSSSSSSSTIPLSEPPKEPQPPVPHVQENEIAWASTSMPCMFLLSIGGVPCIGGFFERVMVIVVYNTCLGLVTKIGQLPTLYACFSTINTHEGMCDMIGLSFVEDSKYAGPKALKLVFPNDMQLMKKSERKLYIPPAILAQSVGGRKPYKLSIRTMVVDEIVEYIVRCSLQCLMHRTSVVTIKCPPGVAGEKETLPKRGLGMIACTATFDEWMEQWKKPKEPRLGAFHSIFLGEMIAFNKRVCDDIGRV